MPSPPLQDTNELMRVRRVNGLLNGVCEATMGDFSPDGVAHFLVASQVFGALPDMHLHLVAVIIFNQVRFPLNVLDGAPDGFPCHPWLGVMLAWLDGRS